MIFAVEDDDSIREIEIYTLTSVGFKAMGFSDGASMFQALRETMPDLIIVIMATAKGSEYDKVESLDAGADDYLVKPFGMMEMVSRVKAVLRRAGRKENPVLTLGAITLNKAEHVVMVAGEKVALTLKEFDLLDLLMENPGIVFTRETLLDRIWMQSAGTETRTVDAHIKTLRQKLGGEGSHIETVRGVGYRIEE